MSIIPAAPRVIFKCLKEYEEEVQEYSRKQYMGKDRSTALMGIGGINRFRPEEEDPDFAKKYVLYRGLLIKVSNVKKGLTVNDFYDNLCGDESDSDSSEPSQKRIKLTGAARGAIVTFFTDAAIDIVSSRRTARGASSGEKRKRVEQNPSLVATRWSTRRRQKKEGS